jgi:pyruvate-formate lyase
MTSMKKTISTLRPINAGYIEKDLEQIVGLQTDGAAEKSVL